MMFKAKSMATSTGPCPRPLFFLSLGVLNVWAERCRKRHNFRFNQEKLKPIPFITGSFKKLSISQMGVGLSLAHWQAIFRMRFLPNEVVPISEILNMLEVSPFRLLNYCLHPSTTPELLFHHSPFAVPCIPSVPWSMKAGNEYSDESWPIVSGSRLQDHQCLFHREIEGWIGGWSRHLQPSPGQRFCGITEWYADVRGEDLPSCLGLATKTCHEVQGGEELQCGKAAVWGVVYLEPIYGDGNGMGMVYKCFFPR